MAFKILFSNIGYARGIDGSLWQHICGFGRHFYCSVPLQQQVLHQLKSIISRESPDLCCFIEIDQGSYHSSYFNQVNFLLDDEHPFSDIADKYGPNSWLGRLPLHIGKSSAFLSKTNLDFERLYFTNGTKRLIHRVELPDNVTLFFTHFSLQKKIRTLQLEELHKLVKNTSNPVIILADFNILQGFIELKPLLDNTSLQVLNDEENHTFTLHRWFKVLDLCICSESLKDKLSLRIIPQPFSDHAALLVEGTWVEK